MKIKNNLLKDANGELIVALIIIAIITTILYAIYYDSNRLEQTYSFSNFFLWIISAIQNLLSYCDDIKSKFLIWLFCIFLPLGVYLSGIAYIFKYFFTIKQILSSLHIKSFNLLADKIYIEYNNRKYNTTCKFNEIKKINLLGTINKISISSNSTFYGNGYIIDALIITIIKNDNSEFSIKATPCPFYSISYIFKIVDYCKCNNINLSHKFITTNNTTNSSTEDFEKQIENYKIYKKNKLTENEKASITIFSMLAYLLSIGLTIYFKDNVANFPEDFGLVIFLMPLIFSLVMDAAFLIDKINFPNPENNSFLKNYEIVFIVKIIIATSVIMSCFTL